MILSKFGYGWFAGIVAAVVSDVIYTTYGIGVVQVIIALTVCMLVYISFLALAGGHGE
jgi:hypothetical protein